MDGSPGVVNSDVHIYTYVHIMYIMCRREIKNYTCLHMYIHTYVCIQSQNPNLKIGLKEIWAKKNNFGSLN